MRNSSLAWIGHPLTVLAALVLAVNDHVLKQLWPGLLTGKLSDLAGLVVAPPLLNLLLRRPRLSIVLTGAGFALVKSTTAGAALASQAWTLAWGPSVILADPSDLLTLPALYAAWWLWNHPDPMAARRTRALVVIPLTVVAVAATSPVQVFRPYSAYAVNMIDGVVVVAVRGGGSYSNNAQGYSSRDGGTSWIRWTFPAPNVVRTSACVSAQCYRVVPGRLKVEQSRDGGWATAWEVAPAVQDRLAQAHRSATPEYAEAAESRAIAAGAFSTGHIVVVANGADGIVLRDVSGGWRRLGWSGNGFAAASAVPLTVPGWYDDSVPYNALLAAIAAYLAALAVGIRRLEFTLAAAGLLAGCYMFLGELSIGFFPSLFDRLLSFVLAPLGLIAVIVSGVHSRAPLRVWVISLATGVLTYFAAMAPFYAWSAGLMASRYSSAIALAIVLGLTTAGAGIVLTFNRRAAPRLRSPDQ